ncbi:MAG: hypothetical protein ABI647_15825 [Gemmatimonadota bacterium]
MSDSYRLTPDRAPPAQLALALQVTLDAPTPLGQLAVGDRFVLDGGGVEGKLVSRSRGSATVAVQSENDRWIRTTWSLATLVQRMRG